MELTGIRESLETYVSQVMCVCVCVCAVYVYVSVSVSVSVCLCVRALHIHAHIAFQHTSYQWLAAIPFGTAQTPTTTCCPRDADPADCEAGITLDK
jgi:hypothetical protein